MLAAEDAFGYEIIWWYCLAAFGFCHFFCLKKYQFIFSYDFGLNWTHHRGAQYYQVRGKREGKIMELRFRRSGFWIRFSWRPVGRLQNLSLSWVTCSVKWRCWASLLLTFLLPMELGFHSLFVNVGFIYWHLQSTFMLQALEGYKTWGTPKVNKNDFGSQRK